MNGTRINTDEHRFYIPERLKDKRLNGTRMNTDKTKDKSGVRTDGNEQTEGYREMPFDLSVFICVHLCPVKINPVFSTGPLKSGP